MLQIYITLIVSITLMEHVTLMVHVTLMEAANIIKVYEGIENGKEVGWLKQCSMGHIS